MTHRISAQEFVGALDAACEAVLAGSGARARYDKAVAAALKHLGIEVGAVEPFIWAVATWRDVRLGDVVRPPGVEGAEAAVVALGPVNNWHASPSASEYRPNESPMEWSNVNVTLRALASGAEMTPPNGMLAGAAVEIRTTAGELAAIEALGGWANRVAVHESSVL